MEVLFLARHGESELSARGIVSGDPAVPCGLTTQGEAQARELGRTLAGQPLQLVVTSDFERCRTTARLALASRTVEWLELSELGDVRNGKFEGRPIDEYRRWAAGAGADEAPPGGGESRTAVAARLAQALYALLRRPETTALAVSHQLPIGLVLAAAKRHPPARSIDAVPHAVPFSLPRPKLEAAAETLEAWAAQPCW